MTPENSGQDILKEYAAAQAKLKKIEREHDLAVHERERAKDELQQIDQEMKDKKGYSPLDDMQERGGVEHYLPFVINWVSRLEEATSESITEANHILNAYGSGNLTALNETVGVEVSGEIPVEDPSVEIADGTVPEVRFEDLAPAGYSKPEEPVHPAMVAVEEPVAAKPESSQAASAPALNWGTGENNRSNGENNNSDNSTHNPWKDSDNNEWGSNLFNKGEMGDPSGFFSEGSGQNHE